MRAALRVLLGVAGVAGVGVGISSLSKLANEHVDSPRWYYLVAGLVSLGAGAALLWTAIVGLRPRS